MGTLKIVQIPASDMQNYSYLLYCPETLKGAAIDPSMKPQELLNRSNALGVEIEFLLNTHGHRDHVAGNDVILEKTKAKLAAHPLDVPHPDIILSEGSIIHLGHGEIAVMHTPGHTPGSLVFKSGNILVTGDTLFVSRCGRADLPGSDVAALYDSLQKLKELPDTTEIYPGHNYGPTPTSTLAWERQHNDYLKCPDLQSFIRLRMA